MTRGSIGLVFHPRVDRAVPVIARARRHLEAAGHTTLELDRGDRRAATLTNMDFVLTFGGDGTFLHGARLAVTHGVPVLGVNLGRLGMLTEADLTNLDQAVEKLAAGDFRIEARTVLSAVLRRGGKSVLRTLGINEVMLHRGSLMKLIRFSMEVGGEEIGTIDADGLLIATATGSTAYSLAMGGPILEPTLADLVLVPMNPFALTVRPIVLAPRTELVVRLDHGEGTVSADGFLSQPAMPGDVLTVKAYPRRLQVVRFGGAADFYSSLRGKIGWGTPLVPRPADTL